MSLQFNISGLDQYVVIENPDHGFSDFATLTVEGMCELLGETEDPTLFSLPATPSWNPPYVAWRLGFYGRERRPEFQITFDGDTFPTTVRAEASVPLYRLVHIAGTFDGERVRLYVDGQLVAERLHRGTIRTTSQRPTMAARSSTDRGGYLVGRVYEVRIWSAARTQEEIDFWKDRRLVLPVIPHLQGLWRTESTFDAEQASFLQQRGFTDLERAFSDFLAVYTESYSRQGADLLSPAARSQFSSHFHTLLAIKASDGYAVLYEDSPATYLQSLGSDIEQINKGGFLFLDLHFLTLSDFLQDISSNKIKVTRRRLNAEPEFPLDREQAQSWTLADNPSTSSPAPEIRIAFTSPPSSDSEDLCPGGRVRIVSPMVQGTTGELRRAFTWSFVDIWFGSLDWEIARKGLPDAVALNDILFLNSATDAESPLVATTISIDTREPQLPIEDVLTEFLAIIERDDVDEVQHVLPFLSIPKNWLFLSPSAEHVWPEKMLGNKWRVDFIVREADSTYVAIEVESPKKRLYKTGSSIEPYAEWTHAEQQVRDYCNFIDSNRDYVEREEKLAGVLKPRGLVIIGRRADLTPDGRRKLAERNADSGRYQTVTFDDIIDRARVIIDRVRAMLAPGKS